MYETTSPISFVGFIKDRARERIRKKKRNNNNKNHEIM